MNIVSQVEFLEIDGLEVDLKAVRIEFLKIEEEINSLLYQESQDKELALKIRELLETESALFKKYLKIHRKIIDILGKNSLSRKYLKY